MEFDIKIDLDWLNEGHLDNAIADEIAECIADRVYGCIDHNDLRRIKEKAEQIVDTRIDAMCNEIVSSYVKRKFKE